jgi:hypothetical protein
VKGKQKEEGRKRTEQSIQGLWNNVDNLNRYRENYPEEILAETIAENYSN